MKSFEKGQKVQFLNEAGEALFIKIDAQDDRMAWVEDEFGFDRKVLLSEIIAKASDDSWAQKIDEESIAQSIADESASKKSFKKQLEKGVMQIDLHIEELMDDFRGMTNHEIVSVQMRAFEQGLNKALDARQKKIIIIHGFGEGILRSEIRKVLKSDYPQCEFLDASYQKYGFGATEILIKRN